MKARSKIMIILLIAILLLPSIGFSDAESNEEVTQQVPQFAMPIIFRKGVYISSLYGYRVHPILKDVRFHSGVDISAPLGTPIFAINSGEVIMARGNSSAGNEIRINHGNGLISRYLHMSSRVVKEGDIVSKGQLIGTVGSTGRSTGPHLHFEIKVNRNTVNPLPIILGKVQ